MIALLRKDWRLNSPAILCVVLIYALLPFLVFFSRAIDEGIVNSFTIEHTSSDLTISAFAGLCISMLILPAFAGTAFARERRDRSADFLASLPVSRARVVASKCIATATLALVPWFLSLLLVLIAYVTQGGLKEMTLSSQSGADALQGLMWVIRIQITLMGVSWLLSSLLRSEVTAAASAILGTILLIVTCALYLSRLERYNVNVEHIANLMANVATFTLGLGGFIAGTAIALRRVSP